MKNYLKSFKKITCILGITFLVMGMVPLPAVVQAEPKAETGVTLADVGNGAQWFTPADFGAPGLKTGLNSVNCDDNDDCASNEYCKKKSGQDKCEALNCPSGQHPENHACVNDAPPPVNCVVSEWGACSADCGGGTRTRTIITPASNGGDPCPALSEECNTDSCIVDQCPDDPDKTVPGACGCGAADTDSDSDGIADCVDGCPADAAKTSAGACGCGSLDTDSDGDGIADCNDVCPDDPDDLCTQTGDGTCPTNSHVQGSKCACDDGFLEMPDGQCVASCPSCYELSTNGKSCEPMACADTNAHCSENACVCNDGYSSTNGSVCSAPNDACPNIWGIQGTVPSGMEVNDNGDCTPEGHTQQDHKIVICHLPPGNPENLLTLSISIDAWKSDCTGLAENACHCPGCHGGDYLGACVDGGPVCGDDVVESGEQCDGSLPAGQYPDGSYCTDECKIYIPPVCGDNEINQTNEVCDGTDGVKDNETCSADCEVIYTCGDEIVNQAFEECDGEDFCTAECTLKEAALLILDPYCIDESTLQWTVENDNGFAVPNVSVELDGSTATYNPLGTGTTFIGTTGDGPSSHMMSVTWPDGSASLSSTLDCATPGGDDDGDDDEPGGGGTPVVVFNAPIPVTGAGGPTEPLIIPVTGVDLTLNLAGLQRLFTTMGFMLFGITMVLEGVDKRLKAK